MNLAFRLAPPIALLVCTGACTSMGTNVSGAFRCEGPDGICAPSIQIDDTALAQIQKSASDEALLPAGPYKIDDGDPARAQLASYQAPPAQANQTYQLSVVFPAYTDVAGNMHARKTVAADVGLPGRSASSVELASRAAVKDAKPGLLTAAENAPVLVSALGPSAAVAPLAGSVANGGVDAMARIKAEVEAKLTKAKPSSVRRQAASFPSPE